MKRTHLPLHLVPLVSVIAWPSALNGPTKIIRINADKIAHDRGKSSFQILPGDTITVREKLFP